MGKTIKSQITMQMVISLVLAILVCELLSVSSLQNNMATQAGNFVEVQAVTNANVVNEWLVEQGNIVHTIRNGVAFMNTKDTDQIMDYLEVNLAKDYKKDAGYYAEVSSSLGQNASGVSDSIRTINGILSDINKAQAELADAVAGVNKNLQEITYSSENMSAETKGVLQSIGRLQENMQQFRV